MCNACGFYCCAMDCFEGCGCDFCLNVSCWPDDDDEYDEDFDYDADVADRMELETRSAVLMRPALRCEAVEP